MLNLSLLLLSSAIFNFCIVAAADDNKMCWSGSSSPQSTNYPPRQIDCSLSSTICQRSHTANINLYTMKCATVVSCQRDRADVQTNPMIYDEVICCNSTLCNSYPDQPNTDIPTPSSSETNNSSVLLLLSMRNTLIVSFIIAVLSTIHI